MQVSTAKECGNSHPNFPERSPSSMVTFASLPLLFLSIPAAIMVAKGLGSNSPLPLWSYFTSQYFSSERGYKITQKALGTTGGFHWFYFHRTVNKSLSKYWTQPSVNNSWRSSSRQVSGDLLLSWVLKAHDSWSRLQIAPNMDRSFTRRKSEFHATQENGWEHHFSDTLSAEGLPCKTHWSAFREPTAFVT